jgi:polyhydroxyalkanoate synthesis regulator phasin
VQEAAAAEPPVAQARPVRKAAKKAAAKKAAAEEKAADAGPAEEATAKKATAKKSTATKTARKPAAKSTSKPSLDFSGKNVAELRSALKGGVITPLNLVMLTRERIDEALEDAVSRGRMTSSDAQKLARDLVARGRKQTDEVLRDLEGLLGGARTTARKRGTAAASRARKQVGDATARARTAADPVIARADRVRRTAGVGPTFPITGYDDLTVSQIQKRLGGLKPAELRKVRDYERRHANRKGILTSVEQKLA